MVVIVATAALFALSQRHAVVEALLQRALADAGLATARFTVDDVEIDHAVVTDVDLGIEPPVTADRIRVRFAPDRLRRQSIDAIEIDGLRASARLTADGLDLGELDALIAAPDGEAIGWRIGSIRIANARIGVDGEIAATLSADGSLVAENDERWNGRFRVHGPLALPGVAPFGVSGPVSLRLVAGAIERLTADLATDALSLPGVGGTAAEAALTYAEDELRLRTRLESGANRLAADAAIALAAVDPADPVAVRGVIEADIASLAIPGTVATAALGGRAHFAATAQELSIVPDGPVALILTGLAAPLHIHAERSTSPAIVLHRAPDASSAGHAAIGKVSIDGVGIDVGGEIPAALSADGTLAADDDDWNGRFQVHGIVTPPSLGRIAVTGPVEFRLAAGAIERLTADLATDAVTLPHLGTYAATAALRFAHGAVRIRGRLSADANRLDVDAELAVGAERRPDTALVRGTIDADVAALPISDTGTTLAFGGRARFAAGRQAISITPETPVELRLSGAAEPIRLSVPPAREPALVLRRAPDAPPDAMLTLGAGEITIGDVTAAIADARLTASVSDAPSIDVQMLRFRLLDVPAWRAPLDVIGTAAFGADAVGFEGTLTSLDGRVAVAFEGSHDLEHGGGRANVRLRALEFRADRLQPRDLDPAWGGALNDVTGRVRCDGALAWSARCRTPGSRRR